MVADQFICQVTYKNLEQMGSKHRVLRHTAFHHTFLHEVATQFHYKFCSLKTPPFSGLVVLANFSCRLGRLLMISTPPEFCQLIVNYCSFESGAPRKNARLERIFGWILSAHYSCSNGVNCLFKSSAEIMKSCMQLFAR